MTSARTGWWWGVISLLALAGCVTDEPADGLDTGSPANPATTPSSASTASTAVDTAVPAATGDPGSTWTVLDVIDGDTLRVGGPGGEQRVRLIGVNAPEDGECYFDEATRALRSMVGDAVVTLVRDESDTDRFGRLLRFVEMVGVDGGVDVGGELVRLGAARSQRFEPDVSRNDRYDELQAEAQARGVGLWAPDACGAPTSGEVRIGVDLQYDAPGDDNTNLNEEWVRFTNEGSAPVDLTGWEVADESSSHRYRFEALVLAPGDSVTVFTGCGSDSSTERYWCNRDSAVWNNSGDTVFLRDPRGNTVLAESYRD